MKYLIGVDEAGRGAWAGPMMAAAVCLLDEKAIAGLDDSKKTSQNQRRHLHELITTGKTLWAVAEVSAKEIDNHGLTWAQEVTMSRAVKAVIDQLDLKPNDSLEVILDGSINYLKKYKNTRAEPKADSLYRAVMAASILAKVTRDGYMKQLGQHYPLHGFDKHVGYGTAAHKQALADHGKTPEHRLSYKPLRSYV